MRYYRLATSGGYQLVVNDGESVYDLTSVDPNLTGFRDLAASAASGDVDDLTTELLDEAEPIPRERLADAALPVVPEEVWAAGVTYEISEEAREKESGMPEMYLDVYESTRPEIFFKSTPSRTVGPSSEVGIRADSEWDVPEPELGIVLYRGEPVGYTIGNDMSSRSIEGENPLYLPQAKVYDRCCSLGPCIASPATVEDPHDLSMGMEIRRDGETVYVDKTTTANMDRSCEELTEYWTAHNSVPELGVLLTGTSLVPDEGFTLERGDEVRIDIEGIGELVNPVVEV